MNDCNGKPLAIGDRVMVVRREDVGKIVTIRAFGTRPIGKPVKQCRADDGTSDKLEMDGDWKFSAWLESKEIAKVSP